MLSAVSGLIICGLEPIQHRTCGRKGEPLWVPTGDFGPSNLAHRAKRNSHMRILMPCDAFEHYFDVFRLQHGVMAGICRVDQ